MDPNHPSNASFVPGHVTPPNQPVLHVRPINLSNNVYSHPEFQPQPQFQPRPQFQPCPQFMPQPQQQTPPSQLALVPVQAQPSINYPPYDDSATPSSIRAATGTSESAYGELKRKLDFACEKAKEILDMLNAGIENYDFIEMLQARQEVEGLIRMLSVEPHAMRQVQPQAVEEVEAPPVEQPQAVEELQSEEAAAQTGDETQGEEHGQEVVEGEQAQPEP
ncbi:hypothetical protein F2Q70_00023158 [Brassica cretica]|uniref:Uncharacterized protein n=1 Tax=Brassica cretica TaxID=69181 RepID=A0A8S9GRA7_BRACR|nr:hypothetical protein F2Q70_00023158 [Brassica cretica]